MAQPFPRQQPPVTSVAGFGSGKQVGSSNAPPPDLLSHHQQAHPNHYMQDKNAGNSSIPQHQNLSYGQVPQVGGPDAPPPLPPKPTPKAAPRLLPATGAQFSHQGPPKGSPFNNLSSGGVPPQQLLPSQPHFDPAPVAAPPEVGSDGVHYAYVLGPKDQELIQTKARASDAESKLKERTLELSRSNSELLKTRQCVQEKKDIIKLREREVEQLQGEIDRLRQTASGRIPPQVAGNEAALQAEVQQYRRMVQDLRTQVEQLRQQQRITPPPSASPDMQELLRLRGEVQWHHGERQRMLNEIGVLKSSQEVLTAQVRTYREDFESEREDRERAHAKIDKMQEEIANLNHIVAMLGGQQEQQNFNPP